MQSDQGYHPEVQHQLLITLVHGTWGRGFFPKPRRAAQTPFWFAEGSPFVARLHTELGDIPHKVNRLIWSGANSIFERDKVAHVLAEHLSAEHAEHPEATQLVIAHSHGGNITLRALHLLQRASVLTGADIANPLLVTLATPFIEIHQVDFGRRSELLVTWLPAFFVGLQFIVLITWAVSFLPTTALPLDALKLVMVVGAIVTGFDWWVYRRAAPARKKRLDALEDATRLGKLTPSQRLLVIRAIDDEASLALALGTIVNYLTAMTLYYLGLLSFLVSVLAVAAILGAGWHFDASNNPVIPVMISVICMLLFFFGPRGQYMAANSL
jgi:hypothetical protein